MTSSNGDLDALKRALGSIPKAELAEICEREFGKGALDGRAWKDCLKRELVHFLVTHLPEASLRELAADGFSRVRAPGFLGFIWNLHSYDGSAGSVLSRLSLITEDHLNGQLRSPQVFEVDGETEHSSFGTSVLAELRYVTEEWQVTPDGLPQLFLKHRTANIAVDLFAGVLTVFASQAPTAGIIAEAVAELLEATITPLTLNQVAVPEVDGALFAPSALRVLEVVYGRFGERYDILYAPTIWIRPVAAGAVAEERASRGEGADMFADDVVRAELRNGAEIRGLRFHLRERAQADDPSASLASLTATVKADYELGISLRLARGNYSTERVMTIYEDLRSLMMRPGPSSGVALDAKLRALA